MKKLLVTGDHSALGYEILYLNQAYRSPSVPFQLLLELIAARLGTPSGYLYTRDIVIADGVRSTAATNVYRLRQHVNNDIVKGGSRSYRLNLLPDEIELGRGVFELPPTHVDPRIMAKLMSAFSHWTECNRNEMALKSAGAVWSFSARDSVEQSKLSVATDRLVERHGYLQRKANE